MGFKLAQTVFDYAAPAAGFPLYMEFVPKGAVELAVTVLGRIKAIEPYIWLEDRLGPLADSHGHDELVEQLTTATRKLQSMSGIIKKSDWALGAVYYVWALPDGRYLAHTMLPMDALVDGEDVEPHWNRRVLLRSLLDKSPIDPDRVCTLVPEQVIWVADHWRERVAENPDCDFWIRNARAHWCEGTDSSLIAIEECEL